MTIETDAEFLDRLEGIEPFNPNWRPGDSVRLDMPDFARLFALARRGAAVTHTDDKRAHSAFANSENASKGEQRTICEACGNSNLAHDRAAWTDDGTSYCPSCLPSPPAGETNER